MSAAPRLRLAGLELATRFTLAPMAGFTNLPFRLLVRELGGVGLATTDMMNARSLLEGGAKTLDLAKTHPDDHPIAAQIYGPREQEVADAARWLEDHGFDAIDFNMGCPVRKVVRRGNGCALMREPARAAALVRAVVEAVRVPVTVKMRLGWDADHIAAPELARELERVGVAGVTVHGRTRGQFYSGEVSLDGIRAVVDAVERMPVIGNGDVKSVEDARRMFEATGCAGIAIGRGALANPFLFAQLAAWDAGAAAAAEPTFEQRLDAVERHVELLYEHQGERHATHMVRKFAKYYRKLLLLRRPVYMEWIQADGLEDMRAKLAALRRALEEGTLDQVSRWRP